MAKGVFSPSVIYGDSSSISCLPYERSKSQILERGETKTHFTNEISQDGIQSSMKNLKIMILWNVCLRGTEHAPWVAIRLKCWQNADIKRNWKSLLSLLRSSPSKTTKSCTAKFFNRSWNNRHYPHSRRFFLEDWHQCATGGRAVQNTTNLISSLTLSTT